MAGDDAGLAPNKAPTKRQQADVTVFGDLKIRKRLAWRLRSLTLAPPVKRRPVDGPVVVAGLFRAASGLGRAVRGCADALESHGVSVLRVDLSGQFGQEDLPPDPRLAAPPKQALGTLIVHVNAPETDWALVALGHYRPRRWRIVGAWVWETPSPPASWRAASRRLSEIWAPSRFAADAIASVADAPVAVVPHAVIAPPDIASDRAGFGLAPGDLVCLTLADGRSSFYRKNPIGAVKVFRAALDGRADARLIVKTRHLCDQPAYRNALTAEIGNDPRIRLIDDDLSEADMWALTASADIFLSLHRAEGFGLPIAEAMALGKPVIATGWSGNMDFMADADAAVAFRLVPVVDPTQRYAPQPDAMWAEPDLEAATVRLRALANDPALRARLAAAGRQAVARFCNGAAYAKALDDPSAAS